MVQALELAAYLDELLKPELFKDYAPNGLQVQGNEQINTIVSGVTACYALIEKACQIKADAILVHHGYFWQGENPCIVGFKHKRIKRLIDQNINLFAYHLPLDAHPELGNNAQLGKLLQFNIEGEFATIGMHGTLSKPVSGQELAKQIHQSLGRAPLHIESSRQIQSVAWCSGGAQRYIEQAANAGFDAYISGEVSEQTFHIARENNMHYFAAGHHATERYGAPAVADHVAKKFGLEHQFVDIDNPV